MDNPALFKMVQELRQQVRFSLMAFQNLRAVLNEQDVERAFFQVDAFLAHAAGVARLLWPARPESKPRGDRLRQELKVAETSPLELPGVREQVERFDEAFEDWLLSLENRSYVDMNLMPVGTVQGFPKDVFQRSFDPQTFRLQLRGVACDLRKVSDELHKLDGAAQQWLRTHNPW